jgi:hypothetical protein
MSVKSVALLLSVARRTHLQASEVTLVLLPTRKSMISKSDASTWRQNPSILKKTL